MRFKWFKKLSLNLQTLFLLGTLCLLTAFYIPLSKYITPPIVSFLSAPLKFCEGVSVTAKQFLKFQDLLEENKRLKQQIDKLTAQSLTLEEVLLENQRLRTLLSLPENNSLQTCVASLIGKDSSNWAKTVIINRGRRSGISEGMPVVLGTNLVGKVIQTARDVSKVVLIVDFNSKIPAKILHTREDGIVFGALVRGKNICKIKYVHQVNIGDKIISSGLGGVYPKGLLIGEVMRVEEEHNHLYKIAEIKPAVDFSTLEEVMVITSQ